MSAPAPRSTSLSRPLMVIYGLPFAGYLALSMPVSMWLMKFATDTLLVAPAVMGTLFFVGRLWDAVSDPMAGYLSDRTRSGLGRRRAWLIGAAIPLAVSYVMLWTPPLALDGAWTIVWIAAAMLFWETASTAFYIPYVALGLELTTDYHERTRLFGWRQMLTTLGFGASLGLLYLIRTAVDARQTAFVVASIAGLVVAVVILLSAWRTPEPAHHQGRGGRGLVKAFRDVARNRHALVLFFVFGIDAFGMGIIGALGAYIADDLVERVDILEMMMAAWMIPQFALIPIWIHLSRRVGKKDLWLFGMVCSIVGFLGLVLLGPGDWELTFGCVVMIGVGTSVSQVMSPSIQADVVDYDELTTGERKEGAYVAVWNFIRKAGSAGAAGIGGLALGLGGYDAMAETQSEAVKDVIRLSCGIIPAAAYAIGIVVFRRFSLDAAEHARLRAEIEAREGD